MFDTDACSVDYWHDNVVRLSVCLSVTDACSVDCAREKNLKRLRRSLRRLRSAINNRETFAIQYVTPLALLLLLVVVVVVV